MPIPYKATVAMLTTVVLLSACGQRDATPTTEVPPTSQATVPPPPGDSTPKAVDSTTRQAEEANEGKTGTGSQSTVGTAASGLPPYTVGGAPEGNPAPSQGQTANEPPKK